MGGKIANADQKQCQKGTSENAIKDIQFLSFCLAKQDFHRDNRNFNWQKKIWCNLPRLDKLSFHHIAAEKNDALCQQKMVLGELMECSEQHPEATEEDAPVERQGN